MFIYKSIKNKLKGESKNFNPEDVKQYDVSKLVGAVQNKNGICTSLFITSENNPSSKSVFSDREITFNVKGNSTFEVHNEGFKNTDLCHDQPQVVKENQNLKTDSSSTSINNSVFKYGSIESLKHFQSSYFDEIVARKSAKNTILTPAKKSNSHSKNNPLSKKAKKRKPVEVKLDFNVPINNSLATVNGTCDNVAKCFFPPLEEAKSCNKKTDVGDFNKKFLLRTGTNSKKNVSKVQKAQLVISSASSVTKSALFTAPIVSSKTERQKFSTETNLIGMEQLHFSTLSLFSGKTQSQLSVPILSSEIENKNNFIENYYATTQSRCFPSHDPLSSQHLIVKPGVIKSQKSSNGNILFESLSEENFPSKEVNERNVNAVNLFDAFESDRNTHKNYETMKLYIDSVYSTGIQKISKLSEKYGLDKKITPEFLSLTNEETYQLWNTCIEQIWNFKKEEKEESLESSDDEPNNQKENFKSKLDHLENSIIFNKDIGCKGYLNFLIPSALKMEDHYRVKPKENIKTAEQFVYRMKTKREKPKSKTYLHKKTNNLVPSSYIKSKSRPNSKTFVNNSPKLDNSLMKDSSEAFDLCECKLEDKVLNDEGNLLSGPQNLSISEIKTIIKEITTKLLAKNEERKKVFTQIFGDLKETFLNQCSDCTKSETIFNPVNILFDEKVKYENADNCSLFNEDAHKSLFDFDSAFHRNIQSNLSYKLIATPKTFQKNQQPEEEECLSEFNSPEDCPAYEKPSILTDDIKKLQVQLASIFNSSQTRSEEDSVKSNSRSIKSLHEQSLHEHVWQYDSDFHNKKQQNYGTQYETIQQKDIQTAEKEYLKILEEDYVNNTVKVESPMTSVEVEHLRNPKVETPINPTKEESLFSGKKTANKKSSDEGSVKKSKLDKCNYNSTKALKELLKSSEFNSKLYECIACYEKVKDFGFQNEMEFIAVDSTCYTENVELLYPYIGKLHGVNKILALKNNSNKKLLKVIGGLEKYDNILDCSFEIYRSLNDRQFPIACNTKKNKSSTNRFLKKACKRLNEKWNGTISPLAVNDDAIRDLQTKQNIKNLKCDPATASIYKADGGRIFVLLNYEEHVRIVVSDKRGDLRRVVSEATDILKIIEGYVNLNDVQFSWSDEFGFLNSNPLKLGLACKITVQVVLENVSKVGCIDACKEKFKVEIEPCVLNKKSKQNTYRIISTEQFGVTEIELLKKMKECVTTLLQIDKNIKQG